MSQCSSPSIRQATEYFWPTAGCDHSVADHLQAYDSLPACRMTGACCAPSLASQVVATALRVASFWHYSKGSQQESLSTCGCTHLPPTLILFNLLTVAKRFFSQSLGITSSDKTSSVDDENALQIIHHRCI